MLTFSSTYKASLQTQLNAHMSGVTKTVMNSPCIDCQTGKDVNRVLSDMKGGSSGYQKRRGSSTRGRGRYNNRRKGYNDRFNTRSRGRGRGGYRGNHRDSSSRTESAPPSTNKNAGKK